MVIIFLSVSIVAVNSRSLPFKFESLSAIKLAILLLVISDVLVFTTASLNSIFIFESRPTPVSPSAGLNIIVGAVPSAVVKFIVVASLIPA